MRIVSIAPFRIAAPDSGGRRLIFEGARQWAASCASFQCLALTTLRDRGRPVPPFRYREFRTASSLWLAFDRLRLLPKIPYYRSLRRYAPRLAREAMRNNPDIVEVHFPWLASIRRHLPPSVRVVLVMQNLESAWHEPGLQRRPGAGFFRRILLRMEAEGLAAADHVVCLTAADAQALIRCHALPPEHVSVLPPGFFPPPDGGAETAARDRIVFVSSGFGDGVASVRRLVEIVVPGLDAGTELVVAGAVCRKMNGRGWPPAVRLAGFVPDLDALIRRSRALVNPERSRTGISMKVLAALAAGIPVVSTPEGARGYEDLVGGPIRVGPVEAFSAILRSVGPLSATDREMIRRYDWSEVGARRMALYQRLLTPRTVTRDGVEPQ